MGRTLSVLVTLLSRLIGLRVASIGQWGDEVCVVGGGGCVRTFVSIHNQDGFDYFQ